MAVVLSEQDLRELLRMPALIEAMARALVAYSAGAAQQPLRTVLPVGHTLAFFGVMPAYQPDPPALGTKLVAVAPGNRDKGLPTHQATVLLMNPDTGELVAVLDGRRITEMRTAAVSAAATRVLAREDAGVLAILGSGVQARSHLEALGTVRPLREVRVWSPTAAHREAFALHHRGAAPVVRAVATAHEAVTGADLIALATASASPVVHREWIAPGAHICAVGACRPDMREMDTALVTTARLFVDSREGALAEAGDIVIPIREGALKPEQIAGEIGELLAGRVPGRRSPEEITLFKSLGMAVEDVAAADLAYRRAAEVGLGRGLVL